MSAAGIASATGRFVVLGHDFAVRTPDPALSRYIDTFFGALARPGRPQAWYDLVDHGAGAKRHELRYEGETVIRTYDPSRTLMSLTWHVNQAVVADPDHVALHAAGAERDGIAIVLAGGMEAGKTTLVAGLLQRGFRYLTDEAVLLDPDTLKATPYPKPLSLDKGSWAVLPHLRPDLPQRLDPYVGRQWQVPATQITSDALAAPTRPRVLIRTRYAAGIPTTLRPVPNTQMLQTLLDQTFHMRRQPRRAVRTLAELVRTSACYILDTSDLDAACDVVICAWRSTLGRQVV